MFSSQKKSKSFAKNGDDAPKFKGIRFCDECDNMLEPKEYTQGDRVILQFECKLCSRPQRVVEGNELDNCVYRNDYTIKAENVHVDPECVKDPTLTRRKDICCPTCKHTEAVSFS